MGSDTCPDISQFTHHSSESLSMTGYARMGSEISCSSIPQFTKQSPQGLSTPGFCNKPMMSPVSPEEPSLDYYGTSACWSLEHDNLEHKLIEDLAQGVHALNDQWTINLRQILNESDIKIFPFTSSPFEDGVKALQKCFQKPLPSTLGEIFPLLLLASTAANKLWHSMKSSFQVALSEDVQQWHRAISSPKGKDLFSQGVKSLFLLHKWPSNRKCQANYGNYKLEEGCVMEVCILYLNRT